MDKKIKSAKGASKIRNIIDEVPLMNKNAKENVKLTSSFSESWNLPFLSYFFR